MIGSRNSRVKEVEAALGRNMNVFLFRMVGLVRLHQCSERVRVAVSIPILFLFLLGWGSAAATHNRSAMSLRRMKPQLEDEDGEDEVMGDLPSDEGDSPMDENEGGDSNCEESEQVPIISSSTETHPL